MRLYYLRLQHLRVQECHIIQQNFIKLRIYIIMEKILGRKVQIPHKQEINDKQSFSQIRLSDNLQRINLQLSSSIHINQLESSQSGSSTTRIISQKKKKKRDFIKTLNQAKIPTTNKMGLRKVVQQQKVKELVKNFIQKLRRNLVQSPPALFQPYNKDSESNFWDRNGFQIPNWFDLTFAFFSVIQIFVLCFVYTLAFVFNKFIDDSIIATLQTFSMCFYAIQIVINFISIKTLEGRKITAIKDIFHYYIKRKFFIDMLCLTVLIVDANTTFFITKYVRLCVVLKIRQCLQKMQKIENVFINSFYRQQYWGLAKVFLINFGYAHFLAVLLLAMTSLSAQNWLVRIKSENPQWYQQYSWAYYWGTTIMLTVGFGDFAATNYKQAICITLIETFSCILLAYNINCVGDMITKIRNQDNEKNNSLRIMRNLARENNMKEEITQKVYNFIDQSDKMKKKFRYQQEKDFISKLPLQLKGEFLKLSNIQIFQNIKFLKLFSEKTLLSLAEKIEVKITHPQQIVFKCEDSPQLLILKNGKVGYCTKLNDSDFNGTVIDVLKANKDEQPKLLHLLFLNNSKKQVRFNVKSLKYSMIYFMDMLKILQIFKQSHCDFQNFCEMRDKSKHVIDQFEVLKCNYCKTNHSKMECPKLHYCPISQMVIFRYLSLVKTSKSQRCSEFHRQRTRGQLAASCPFKLQRYFHKLSQDIYKKKMIMNQCKLGQTKLSNRKEQQIIRSDKQMMMAINKMNTILMDDNQLQELQQSIVQKIRHVVNERRAGDREQQFWDLECDISHNFKFYFRSLNSNQIANGLTFREKLSMLHVSSSGSNLLNPDIHDISQVDQICNDG